MRLTRLLSLLLALMLAGATVVQAHHREGHVVDDNETEEEESEFEEADDNETEDDDGDGLGRNKSRDRDHPQNKTPQGRALGHDTVWHECRTAAADNETLKKECHDAAMQRAIERHDAIKAARANGSVGGELNISADNVTIDSADGVDIEVDTEGPEELRVEVGADLERGQTIVLDVDPSMFDDAGNLVIAYYDIADDGTETLNTSFAPADSLEDVLDPDDDDGRPEYWLEEDDTGMHVFVSIASWSVHAITLNSDDVETATPRTPYVVVGVLLAVFVVMGAVLWWQRPGRLE